MMQRFVRLNTSTFCSAISTLMPLCRLISARVAPICATVSA
jgi:hypothetical protein